MPTINAPSQITIVDFSPDRFVIRNFDNATLESFVQQPQPSWVKCRWISVRGLSWDVVQVLGRHKNLHNLALEDIMNLRNRTKAWVSPFPHMPPDVVLHGSVGCHERCVSAFGTSCCLENTFKRTS